MTKAILQANALELKRGPRRVVSGFSAGLRAGEWVAIVGPNGAGKSTLLSALAGLYPVTAGTIELQGRAQSSFSASARAKLIAWIAQQGESSGDISAIDVVRLGRLPHHGLFGAPSAADEAAVRAAMQETECTQFAERRLSALSGGERQRVLLARALAVEAPILLLDEPTTHLDAPHQRALLRSVHQRVRNGSAAAVVLHDLTLALMADRLWVMQQGRLIADAPPGDPMLHAALVEVFDQAIVIEALERDGQMRYLARPRW